jgi:hypothetical protein
MILFEVIAVFVFNFDLWCVEYFPPSHDGLLRRLNAEDVLNNEPQVKVL